MIGTNRNRVLAALRVSVRAVVFTESCPKCNAVCETIMRDGTLRVPSTLIQNYGRLPVGVGAACSMDCDVPYSCHHVLLEGVPKLNFRSLAFLIGDRCS